MTSFLLHFTQQCCRTWDMGNRRVGIKGTAGILGILDRDKGNSSAHISICIQNWKTVKGLRRNISINLTSSVSLSFFSKIEYTSTIELKIWQKYLI